MHRPRRAASSASRPNCCLPNGLFDRIHVADRVAYLCALADLRDGDERRSVEVDTAHPGLPASGSVAPTIRPFLIE